MKGPALGMIELKSVARGIKVTDGICKKASVDIIQTSAVCPGKYMILFSGEVADVEEAFQEAAAIGRDLVINQIILSQLHPDIVPAISGTTKVAEFKSVGVIESFSISSCVIAADMAAKACDVKMIEIRLANGLGGKGYFVMTGEQYAIEEALSVAAAHIREEGMLAGCEIIENPHPELIEKGLYW
ncbi:MAG: BMC domain-containing protein [Bdellovibrionales bacterium]|jgi:microcompartment protein CcmL/EutN|nr:BMC domain-containing protein [Bdellovibrionales bacterium]MBT3527220.1 BMC domain-containing protein [Bdellovibrionales bacterium]MBT7768285.1 BMC domain-containing protein [Bdellovibrionales bacterium]